MDIAQLILDDHHEQRRLFSFLQQIDRRETDQLDSLWTRLSTFLEVHAKAEENFFYPELLKSGKGAGGVEDAKSETRDAIKDHNEIRDAIRNVAAHPVGSSEWFHAVDKVNEVNSEHMDEEERQGLADFRLHVDLSKRHDLAIRFTVYEAKFVNGIVAKDVDPEKYIEDRTR